MTRTEKLLRELIAIPSINPGLTSSDDPRAGEERVAAYLVAAAAKAGLDVEERVVEHGRNNVLAWLKPRGKVRSRVVLAPHMDTVGGEEDSLYVPRAKGRRLYGRGACDTKGSVAAMLGAVMDVARLKRRPEHTEIVFIGLVDEEAGQAGSRALVKEGFKADLAIVGEPTSQEVVTSHKGVLWLELITRGKAAHGAKPELGKNAVHEMARVVDVMETEYAASLKKNRHKLLGRGSVNVGAISGGRQPNIVPDRCRILVDRRMLPGERDAVVKKDLETLLKKRKLKAAVRRLQSVPCWPLETDPRNPLVGELMGVAGQRKPVGVDYFSDAAVFGAGGIPSVLFGPGDIAQAHRPDEWIEIRQLDAARATLARFLKELP